MEIQEYNELKTKFFETLNIPKVEYQTPGRDWDDDGLASWYVEHDYPQLDGTIFGDLIFILLDMKRNIGQKDEILLSGTSIDCCGIILNEFLNTYNEMNKEQQKDLRNLILELFGMWEDME